MQMRVANKNLLGGLSKQQFCEKYARRSWDGYGWTNWKVDQIVRDFPQFHFVRTRDIVELPDESTSDVQFEVTEKEKKAYGEVHSDTGYEIATMTKRYEYAGRFSGRMSTVLDIIKSTAKQVVVFCQHTECIKNIYTALTAVGINTAVVDGGHDTESLWLSGEARIIVAQYQSAGLGRNWQQSHILICAEPTWSYLDYSQARGRIRRIGQSEKTLYYNVIANYGMDEDIYLALKQKKDFTVKFKKKEGE
jgi:SNF2 family DNA or RNA helicase